MTTWRRWVVAASIAAVVGVAPLGAPAEAMASTYRSFAGTGTGAIADGGGACGSGGSAGGAPRDVQFAVSGLQTGTPLTGVRVTGLALTHASVRDLTVTLIAPDTTEQVLFDHTGVAAGTPGGLDADLAGPYTFQDLPPSANHAGDWWFFAAFESTVPAGRYPPTDASNQVVPLTSAFASVADPNGVWTLRVVDRCSGATGAVGAATLQLRTQYDESACLVDGMTRVQRDGELATAEAAFTAARTTLGDAATKQGVADGDRAAKVAAVTTATAAATTAGTALESADTAVTKATAALKKAKKVKKAKRPKAVAQARKRLAAAVTARKQAATTATTAAQAVTDATAAATTAITVWNQALVTRAAADTAYDAARTARDAARDAAQAAHAAEDFCRDQ